jgi:dUTP pyrophosphatase
MKKIAKFYKVSPEQFIKDWRDSFGENIPATEIMQIYEGIKLPKRATKGSAGYGFFAPCNIVLEPGESMKVPTGIRCSMEEGWVLKCYPRSSYGFKFQMRLSNTVGIIDSDYFNADNEGHIFEKIVNGGPDKTICIPAGTEFCQGVFIEFGITEDDDADGIRTGGLGSTTK